MKEIYVVKIGGNVIDNPPVLNQFLKAFSNRFGKGTAEKGILVHGGGKLLDNVAAKLDLPQRMINGRRITDGETLRLSIMVFAGFINKTLTATLNSLGCKAVGLSAMDASMVISHKRNPSEKYGFVDFGFVGDIDSVDTALLELLVSEGHSIVLAPITQNNTGQILNTNADTVAQALATALSKIFKVTLIYCFDKSGVLMNPEDDDSVIPLIKEETFLNLQEKNSDTTVNISAGMIPKLENAFEALRKGVESVVMGKAERLDDLINSNSGTKIQL